MIHTEIQIWIRRIIYVLCGSLTTCQSGRLVYSCWVPIWVWSNHSSGYMLTNKIKTLTNKKWSRQNTFLGVFFPQIVVGRGLKVLKMCWYVRQIAKKHLIWKTMKDSERQWKTMKDNEKQWKTMKNNERQSKTMATETDIDTETLIAI